MLISLNLYLLSIKTSGSHYIEFVEQNSFQIGNTILMAAPGWGSRIFKLTFILKVFYEF